VKRNSGKWKARLSMRSVGMLTEQSPFMPESSDTDPDGTDDEYYRVGDCKCLDPFVCRGRCLKEGT
jgi:hypothetical protein